jgi:predicted aspartyl protease
MRNCFLAVATMILAFPASAGAAPDTRADAESAFVAARFGDADRAYAEILARQPKDTLALIRRGQIALFENRLAEARPLLKRAGDAGASPVRVAGFLGEVAYREDDYATAAPLFRQAGHEAKAKKLESFGSMKPWRIEGPDSVSIPMEQVDPLPLVQATVNGQGPYLFLIDTGGAEIVLDPSIADSLHLDRYGDEEGTFAGGRRRGVTQSSVKSLGFGALTIRDIPVGLIDTRRFAGIARGRFVAGIVGTVLLDHFRATLDYPRSRLVLERRSAGAHTNPGASAGRIEVPFWMAGDHFMVAAGTVDSSGSQTWFVDSGLAGAAFTAPAATLIDARIAVPDTSSGFTGQGGGGSVRAAPFRVRRLTLGGAERTDLLGIFGAFPPTLERGFGFRIGGIVSHAFLEAWSVTFDFDRMRILLDPPAH